MPSSVPRHLAVIMDGNGRWAQSQGLPRIEGHRKGADVVREVVTACREVGVEALTLYSFSTENWSRPKEEVTGLMRLLFNYITDERSLLMDKGIRLNAIGELNRLPKFVRLPLWALMKDTAKNKDMTLTLALSYGSRTEIVAAVKAISTMVKKNKIGIKDIDEELISSSLYTHDLPEPDLIIRTSGEWRLSNFLLWQAAYAELYISDVPWPEFSREHLMTAFESYAGRERRFGKTSKQLKGTIK